MIVLRILLYILLGIAALLGVILSMRLKIYIRMTDTFGLRAGLGPVVLTLAPAKPKKPVDLKDFTYEKHQKRLKKEQARARKKAEKAEQKKQAKALAKEAEKTAREEAAAEENGEPVKKFTLEAILDIIGFVLEEFPRFTSYIHTEIRTLDITVAGKDAADCAKKYGIIAQLTSYLLEILDNGTALKPVKADAVAVRADFLASKTVYKLDIRIRLRLFSIVRVGFHTLVWFIRTKIKNK
ncbi:MAG: hypothetical protein IKU40_11120 [Clostridia bacterium]|nr:hypothetical protein [Clostridia bacterium]